ncbi:hypothetical protein HK102_009837, partial [Quaeritorhiza haematococci]
KEKKGKHRKQRDKFKFQRVWNSITITPSPPTSNPASSTRTTTTSERQQEVCKLETGGGR